MELDEIRDELWLRLARAAADRDDPYYTPVFATTTGLRTVVLRSVDPRRRQLTFHTDLRSDKVAEIEADPRVHWLFYDPRDRTQIRLVATAQVHRNGELHAERWLSTGPANRRDFGSELPPGHPIERPIATEPPTLEASAPWRDRFGVVVTTVESADWLRLGRDGHRRARFDWSGRGAAERWVVP